MRVAYPHQLAVTIRVHPAPANDEIKVNVNTLCVQSQLFALKAKEQVSRLFHQKAA